MGSSAFRGTLAVGGVCALFAACDSRLGGSTVLSAGSSDTNAFHVPDPAETARIQAFLDSRYTAAEVKHTFKAKSGQTIDCVEFLDQPGAKELARRGTPVTEIPKALLERKRNQGAGNARLSDNFFNGSLDEYGSPRECVGTTVPVLRITADEIVAAGGLDGYESRRRSRPSPVRPPRPDPSHPVATTPVSKLGTSVIPASPLPSTPSTPEAQPVPPVPGYCLEFETEDLPNYAHVQQTAYAPESGYFSNATASFSIFQPNISSYTINDHSLIEMWVYSGWGFNNPAWGCSCTLSFADAGPTNPPCTEDFEFGWMVESGYLNNVPYFFTFATATGYNPDTSCYNGTQPTDGSGCPVWMQEGVIMPGVSTLSPSSDMGGGPQYQLYVDGSWSSTLNAWVVSAGECEVSDGSCVVEPPDEVGYYAGTSYTGPMSKGEAQTIQYGGEVAQQEGGKFTMPMGSGLNPSMGWEYAAYVYGTGNNPPAVGPVTVPTAYTYATSPGAPAGAFSNSYFYLGNGTDDYTWTQVTFGSSQPTVFAPTLPVSVADHVQALAPVYVWDASTENSILLIYALTSANGNNRLVQEYDWLTNAWHTPLTANYDEMYLFGLTTDFTSASQGLAALLDLYYTFWGLTYFVGNSTWGSAYGGETGEIVDYAGTWDTYLRSIAVASPTLMYATSNQETCPGLSGTSEPCILEGNQGYANGWSGWSGSNGAIGAEEVVVDSITQQLYALDNDSSTSGSVWIFGPNNNYFNELTMTQCASPDTVQTCSQIVAKNGVVYCLGPKGTPWFYTSAKGCWTQAGPTMYWLTSLAVDNGDTVGVWGVDKSGNIWTAN
jgi:hypothetical protein